ncbi:MAG: precorrin-4 C(11)-methyltransferase, partial [Devosia sp.]
DEEYIITTLAEMRTKVRAQKLTRTALVFVGHVFGAAHFKESRLYAQDFAHVLRNAGKKKARAQPEPAR